VERISQCHSDLATPNPESFFHPLLFNQGQTSEDYPNVSTCLGSRHRQKDALISGVISSTKQGLVRFLLQLQPLQQCLAHRALKNHLQDEQACDEEFLTGPLHVLTAVYWVPPEQGARVGRYKQVKEILHLHWRCSQYIRSSSPSSVLTYHVTLNMSLKELPTALRTKKIPKPGIQNFSIQPASQASSLPLSLPCGPCELLTAPRKYCLARPPFCCRTSKATVTV
jgi:hypothetical protein